MSKPTYNLETIQKLLSVFETRYITHSSSDGAAELGIAGVDKILDVVKNLKETDFYKTMKSEKIPGLYQDVYKTKMGTKGVYIKLQLNKKHNKAVVISFKPDTSKEESRL